MPLPWPSGQPLSEVFNRAVAELCGDAAVVGVNLSGGLDSLAVLVAVTALRPARRIISFTVDLVDDSGLNTAAVVAALLDKLQLRTELVVVDPEQSGGEPPWSPIGPRFDALPQANALVNQLAAQAGCRILLSGNGADELLSAGSFALVQVARRHGLRGTRRYLADLSRTAPGTPGELCALAATMLPARFSARLYWAANWPGLCSPTVADVLDIQHRQQAEAWASEWVHRQIAAHAAGRRSWAEADRFDTFWPRSLYTSAGQVPEASPFLHPRVVAAGLAMPIADRYDPWALHTYHRIKPQVGSPVSAASS